MILPLVVADTTGELSKHYENDDIFFINEEENVDLYLMWWAEIDREYYRGLSHEERKAYRQRLIDVSMITGVIDQWTAGDYIDLGKVLPLVANGRYIHGKCTDPRKGGKATIRIEPN